MLVDLDDTIIDYRTGVDPCWRLVCADAAACVPGLDAGALFQEVLRTREWYWSDPERHRIGRADLVAASAGVVLRFLRKLGFDLPDLARDLGRSYREKRDEVAVLIPGAVEVLRRFRSRGIALAMITKRRERDPEGKDRALPSCTILRPHPDRGPSSASASPSASYT